MSRYLDPKSDIVFKKIFGSHPNILKSFLNAILPLPADRLIEELVYLSPEQVPVLPALKYPIVDVKCKDKLGRTFIVEMQIQWVSAFMQRVLFNTSAAYVHQLSKGEAYMNLSPVYGLALLAHNLMDQDPEWFHHYKMTNVQDSTKALEDMQIVIVELLKFKPQTFEEKKLTALWLRFMSEIGEKTREIDPALLTVPEIKEAIALSEESAYTVGELNAYNTYWDSVRTEKTLFAGKYAEGKAEGRAEGKAEEAQAVARNLLALGVDLSLVSQATGLSIETLKAMAMIKK